MTLKDLYDQTQCEVTKQVLEGVFSADEKFKDVAIKVVSNTKHEKIIKCYNPDEVFDIVKFGKLAADLLKTTISKILLDYELVVINAEQQGLTNSFGIKIKHVEDKVDCISWYAYLCEKD